MSLSTLQKSLTRQLYRVINDYAKKAGNDIQWGSLSTNTEIIYLWTPENASCPEFYTGGPRGDIWSSVPITYTNLVRQGNSHQNDIANLTMVILGLKTNIYSKVDHKLSTIDHR
jgi:hypothetical protein